MEAIHFGLRLPQDVTDFGEIRAIVQRAEELGYHSVWAFDHFYNFPYIGNPTVLEPWTLLSVIAGATSRIRFGTLVCCNNYRSPALLAKMAATLDVLSGGRLELGYGAGWHQEEFAGYGYDFPPIATRIRQMEEGLLVMKQLWREERATFEGKYYRLQEAVCDPKPVQKPHPPITIGGGGEQLMLRAIARHADMWNYFSTPLPELEHKTRVLDEHCRAIGRDPSTLRRSLMTPTITADAEKEVRDQLEAAKARGYMWTFAGNYIQGTPDIVVPRLRDYIRRGVTFFHIQLPDPRSMKQIEYFARAIMPEVSGSIA